MNKNEEKIFTRRKIRLPKFRRVVGDRRLSDKKRKLIKIMAVLIIAITFSYTVTKAIEPIIETQCRYISPAKYGDTITVKSFMEKLTPVKFEIKYEVYRKNDNKLLATGKTLMAFLNKETFTPVNLKKFRPEIWEKFNSLK